MWKDASEHARWRLEYSTAQLYLSVLHVSELMWRNFTDNYMEEKLPRLAWTHRLPLNDFVQEYHKWFQCNVIAVENSESMCEIVIDGPLKGVIQVFRRSSRPWWTAEEGRHGKELHYWMVYGRSS